MDIKSDSIDELIKDNKAIMCELTNQREINKDLEQNHQMEILKYERDRQIQDKEKEKLRIRTESSLLSKFFVSCNGHITMNENYCVNMRSRENFIDQDDEHEGNVEECKTDLFSKTQDTCKDRSMIRAMCIDKWDAKLASRDLANGILYLEYLEDNVKSATDMTEIEKCHDACKWEMRRFNGHKERSRLARLLDGEAREYRDQYVGYAKIRTGKTKERTEGSKH